MISEKRIEALYALGIYIDNLSKLEWQELCLKMKNENPWFTEKSIKMAMANIRPWLQKEELQNWIKAYDFEDKGPKVIGLVLAGNIPFVGFHDILCVLVSGNTAQSKLSSKDKSGMLFLKQALDEIAPDFSVNWQIVDRLENFDAVIATGSDNASRYFESYFSKYPHIIRKNRTSVAILKGDESKEQLQKIGEDVFSYFGLGCRNVTHLMIPLGYDPAKILDAFEMFREVAINHKYVNNYDYYRSIFLVNQDPHLASDFLIMREDDALFVPVANLNYSVYKDRKQLDRRLDETSQSIQCIISYDQNIKNAISPGKAQNPTLTDYADGIDTMAFLSSL